MSRSRLSVRTAVGDALALGVRKPVSVTVWGLVSILGLVGALALLCWAVSGVDLVHSDAPFSPDSIREMIRLQAASVLIDLATLGFTAVLLAAVTRAGLGWRHGRSLAFMRLGLDEFRVLVVQVALGMGLCFLLAPLVLIGIGVGMAVWPLEPVVRNSAIAATAVVLVAFFIWIALRVVLITPMTVAVRKFSFIEGWRITRGRVWRLLGIGILSWLACLVASILLVLAIAVAVHLAGFAGMVDLHALKDVDWSDHGWAMDWDGDWALEMDWRTAGIVAAVAALPIGWLSGMTLALSYAPWASAYRQIATDPEPEPTPEFVSAPPPEPQPESHSEPHPEPHPEAHSESHPEAHPEPAPEHGSHSGPASEHVSQAEAAPESHAESPTEPVHEAHAEEAPGDAEHQAHAEESHPVADDPDHDAVETREDHHRG